MSTETFAEKKARLLKEKEEKKDSKPKIKKEKVPYITEEISHVTGIPKHIIEGTMSGKTIDEISLMHVDINALQKSIYELVTDNQRLNTTISDYASKFAQIQQQIATIQTNDSKQIDSNLKIVLKDAITLIYNSNYNRYKHSRSSGMLNALDTLKKYFDTL